MTQREAFNVGGNYLRQEIVLPSSPTTTIDNYWYEQPQGSGIATGYVWKVPDDFLSLVSAKIMIIPDATETIQWDMYVAVSAVGEDRANDTRTDLDRQQDVTVDLIEEANINQGGVFTGIAAGDWLGIRFVSNTNSLRTCALIFTYYSKY